MATITETTETNSDAYELANAINDALTDGATIWINGNLVRQGFRTTGRASAAASWQNGSLSYETPARKGSGTRTEWLKAGATFQLRIEG